jgi:hypothetical protein
MEAVDTDRVGGTFADPFREQNCALLRRALALAARDVGQGDCDRGLARLICWIICADEELKAERKG